MGSIGGMELVLVLVVALLLFGPRKLPQISRTIGSAISELRKASRDFKMNLDREVGLDEVREVRDGLKNARREVSDTVEAVRGGVVEPTSSSPVVSDTPDRDEDSEGGGTAELDDSGSDAEEPRTS